MTTPGFTREELVKAQAEGAANLYAPPQERDYRGLEMSMAPLEAKRRLQELQAFVQAAMVKDVDYGRIPGVDKDCLFQQGAQKLAELYGFSHRFVPVESVKDWERGFFYFEYRCILESRRDGSLIGEGIGSCNSRESKYAGRWVFGNDVPPGLNRATLKVRKGTSKKNGKPFELFLVPNEDPYSLVNTLQKMGAKRAYIHAVIAATRSSGLFTQDVEDLPPEAFGEVEPAHDADTGEVIDAPTSKQLTEMHLQRIASATTVDALRQAGEAIKADEGRIARGDIAYLRGMAKQQKDKIKAARNDTEPSPAPDSLKDAAL